MTSFGLNLPQHQRALVDRFIAACQADERVAAAFLGGSYGRGTADGYSDLDLYVVTDDDAYETFMAGRKDFLGRLGEAVFLETFGVADNVFFIYSDGSEGELRTDRASRLRQIPSGPYQVLLDRRGLLAGVALTEPAADPDEQRDTLRRQVVWFWHEVSHVVTALGRGQLWWAYGQLEALRAMCVNLARLRRNVADPDASSEPYWKVDQALPAEALAALLPAPGTLAAEAILQGVVNLVSYYQAVAPGLARDHGIPYPAGAEQVMLGRLADLVVAQAAGLAA